jgi:hypothetical protein
MDAEQKLQVRNKILEDIAREGINPGCNKRQIEQAIDNVANYRSVAANRRLLDEAVGIPGLPDDMKARVLTAIFSVEEKAVKEQRRLAEGGKPDGKVV